MALVFEIELNTEDGTFVCSGLVDNQRCATYRSDENVSRALCGGAMALLQSLRETQPVVGLQSDMKGRLHSFWSSSE